MRECSPVLMTCSDEILDDPGEALALLLVDLPRIYLRLALDDLTVVSIPLGAWWQFARRVSWARASLGFN